MSSGIFLKSNISRLHTNWVLWVEKIGDVSKAFKIFIPEFQRSRVGWIYAGRTVEGIRFKPLVPWYREAKKAKYGNQPIMIASGALIGAIRGGEGWVQKIGAKELTLGIDLPYAGTHQFGDPERKIPQRNYFLTKEGTLTKMDYAQLLQAMEGQINDSIKAQLNNLQ